MHHSFLPLDQEVRLNQGPVSWDWVQLLAGWKKVLMVALGAYCLPVYCRLNPPCLVGLHVFVCVCVC